LCLWGECAAGFAGDVRLVVAYFLSAVVLAYNASCAARETIRCAQACNLPGW